MAGIRLTPGTPIERGPGPGSTAHRLMPVEPTGGHRFRPPDRDTGTRRPRHNFGTRLGRRTSLLSPIEQLPGPILPGLTLAGTRGDRRLPARRRDTGARSRNPNFGTRRGRGTSPHSPIRVPLRSGDTSPRSSTAPPRRRTGRRRRSNAPQARLSRGTSPQCSTVPLPRSTTRRPGNSDIRLRRYKRFGRLSNIVRCLGYLRLDSAAAVVHSGAVAVSRAGEAAVRPGVVEAAPASPAAVAEVSPEVEAAVPSRAAEAGIDRLASGSREKSPAGRAVQQLMA
jgi:hypothetical protein